MSETMIDLINDRLEIVDYRPTDAQKCAICAGYGCFEDCIIEMAEYFDED